MDTYEKHLVAVSMKNNGSTFKEIGGKLGVTRQRAQQIYSWIPKPLAKKTCVICNAVFTDRFYKKRCPPCSKEFEKKDGREYVRTLVRIRDNYTCQDCGERRDPETARKEGKRLFDTHHLNGLCGKMSRGYDKIGNMAGLITLCHKCHFNRPEHKTKAKTLTKLNAVL